MSPTLIADSFDLSDGASGSVPDGDGVKAPRLDTVDAPEFDWARADREVTLERVEYADGGGTLGFRNCFVPFRNDSGARPRLR